MLVDVMRWIGYGLCHQLTERSFFGGGVQVPVCARDTGIYVGFIASFAVITLLARGSRPSGAPAVPATVLGLVMLASMMYDGFTSYAGWRETSNAIRLATGVGAGYAIALFVVPMLNGQLWRAPGAGRVLAGGRQLLVWAGSAVLVFVAGLWAAPWLGIGYSLLVTISILFTFTAVNLVIVALIPAFERRAVRLRNAAVPITLALSLTIGEIAASGWLKGVLIAAAG